MPRTSRTGRRWTAAGVALAVALSGLLVVGCDPYEIEAQDQLGRLEQTTYPLVILSPPQLLFEHASYQGYQYGTELAAFLSREGRIPVMTAWELDVEQAEDGGLPSDVLMALLDASGASVTDVLLAELRIEEAMTSRTVQAPLMMGGGTEHQYQSDVVVTLTLRTAAYREQVAQTQVAFEDPAFPEGATAANPRPVLREGVLEAGRELIRRFEEAFPDAPEGAVPDVELLYNPRDLFAYHEDGQPPLEDAMRDMDELDRLASRLVYYQYFEPDLSGAALRRFESTPPGLLVEAVEEPDSPLQPDDYVVEVAGQRVAGWHTFARAFLRASPGSQVRVEVERNGQRRHLRLPVRPFSD